MTVVNPKSISGINSITTGSGSDNLLTIHTSDASSTERVRINSSGDVIVGSGITVSPDGDIFATGVTTSTTFVGALSGNATSATTSTNVTVADESSDTTCFPLFATDATGNVAPKSGSNLTFNSSTGDLGATKVTASNVTSSGTILVDTTSYSEVSTDGDDIIIGSTSDTSKGLSIVGSTSGGINNIFFTDGASYKNQGNIQYRHADDSMRISVNQNERIRIFSDATIQMGNPTGVGNSNPAFSGSTVNGLLRLDGTTPTLYMRETDRDMGAQDFYIGRTSETVYIGNQGGDIVFQTSDNGASTTERCRIRATSVGLAIGGTGDANTLDDYEEGTFTPNVSQGGSVTSYTHQKGSYRRIGSLINFNIYMQINGSGNGDLFKIGGLPFTSSSSLTNEGFGGAWFSYDNNAFQSSSVLMYVPTANATLNFHLHSGGNFNGNAANVFGNRDFIINGHYFVA